MKTLRLFIATDIDESTKEKIQGIRKTLLKLAPNIKWTAPDTWHLTIKFLGETKEEKINAIIEKCNNIAKNYSTFYINLKGISSFPNTKLPRVIFIDTIYPQQFKEMALALHNELLDLDFKKEDRDFHPHLTLGRIKDIKSFLRGNENIMEKIIETGKAIDYKVIIDSFHLYQSKLSQKGPTYIKIKSFCLIR
jgi:2'-5' RNA ligase